MPRRFNESIWCVLKHVMLARRHGEEVLDKLYRGDRGEAEQAEAIELVSELLHVNKHSHEVVELAKDAKIKDTFAYLADRARELYQRVNLMQLPFPTAAKGDIGKQMETVRHVVNELRAMEGQLAKLGGEMEQELGCPRCFEDIRPAKPKYGGTPSSIGVGMLAVVLAPGLAYLADRYGFPELARTIGAFYTDVIQLVAGIAMIVAAWMLRAVAPQWVSMGLGVAGGFFTAAGLTKLIEAHLIVGTPRPMIVASPSPAATSPPQVEMAASFI